MGRKRFDVKFGANLHRELPTGPGVYLFRDADGSILYVGKAKDLRRRLQGYRNATRRKAHRKMALLVREASTLEIRPQPSEGQALLLENELIRTEHPPYNVDGAFSFLYPAVGIWRNEDQTYFCFTTKREAWTAFPFDWYGAFRSRGRTREAFDAMVSLLGFVGHLDGRAQRSRFPRLRGSRIVGIRRLDDELVGALGRLWSGESRDALERLALCLVDKLAARRNAAEVENLLRTIDAFYRADLKKLRGALLALGRKPGFVSQEERDALFITLRTA